MRIKDTHILMRTFRDSQTFYHTGKKRAQCRIMPILRAYFSPTFQGLELTEYETLSDKETSA